MKITFSSQNSVSANHAFLYKRPDGIYELEIDGYYISFPHGCPDFCSVMEHLTILFSSFEKGLSITEVSSSEDIPF